MVPGVGTIERAFQLAKTGQFRTLTQIQQRLRSEGYDESYLETKELRKQLRAQLALLPAEPVESGFNERKR